MVDGSFREVANITYHVVLVLILIIYLIRLCTSHGNEGHVRRIVRVVGRHVRHHLKIRLIVRNGRLYVSQVGFMPKAVAIVVILYRVLGFRIVRIALTKAFLRVHG